MPAFLRILVRNPTVNMQAVRLIGGSRRLFCICDVLRQEERQGQVGEKVEGPSLRHCVIYQAGKDYYPTSQIPRGWVMLLGSSIPHPQASIS